MHANGIFYETMTNMNWTEIKDSVDNDALVLLPLGVIEEHGPHLCLGTDIYTAHVYCLTVRQKLEEKGHAVVIAPPFYWGICQSTGGFIGSFEIRKDTAKALIVDIISSLSSFGYKNVFGVNAHGDVAQNLMLLGAFDQACEETGINARYVFEEARLGPYGLSGNERYLCLLAKQLIHVSTAQTPDIHAGDTETAMINTYYPSLVDTEKAMSLPPVPLADDHVGQWLFESRIHELSPQGYLGSPADYKSVLIQENVEDYAERIAKAIIERIM
jgi:creatinine amidohydrolase